jgi:hypothetical protein
LASAASISSRGSRALLRSYAYSASNATLPEELLGGLIGGVCTKFQDPLIGKLEVSDVGPRRFAGCLLDDEERRVVRRQGPNLASEFPKALDDWFSLYHVHCSKYSARSLWMSVFIWVASE